MNRVLTGVVRWTLSVLSILMCVVGLCLGAMQLVGETMLGLHDSGWLILLMTTSAIFTVMLGLFRKGVFFVIFLVGGVCVGWVWMAFAGGLNVPLPWHTFLLFSTLFSLAAFLTRYVKTDRYAVSDHFNGVLEPFGRIEG